MDAETYFQKQRPRLIQQILFAKENVPFYKKALDGINVRHIESYKEFCDKIPIVESSLVIKNPRMFVGSRNIEFVKHSSGTTGSAKQIFLTKGDINQWIIAGRISVAPYYKPGMVVTHSRRKERYYLSALDGAVVFSHGVVKTFNPTNIREIVECIKQSDLLLEYTEMIYYISEKIKDIPFRLNKEITIVYAGNQLDSDEIKDIRRNFQKAGISVRIYSDYSSSEIGPIGCSAEENIPIFDIVHHENVFIETVNHRTHMDLDVKGKSVVVTALGRTGSVFIRYKIGDTGCLRFKKDRVLLDLKGKQSGVKIASVFFSPQYVFHEVRRFLKIPVFCSIEVTRQKYFGKIDITVITEKLVSIDKRKNLREYLLEKLEFIDDVGSTVEFNLFFECLVFKGSQRRKGFIFRDKEV